MPPHDRTKPNLKTCSPDCSKARHKARVRNWHVSHRDVMVQYQKNYKQESRFYRTVYHTSLITAEYLRVRGLN